MSQPEAVQWRVPFSDVDLDRREIEAVSRVLEGGWLTQGAETSAFEAAFQAFIGVKHAIAVSSATAALHLALVALGVGPSDEVLVPSLTFVATVNAVLYTGASPVFVDICGPDDLTISAEELERKCSPRTRAVIVMHYGGYPCDMPRIMGWARDRGLVVVEDAAHAPGAALEGRNLGAWGDIGCFSFFANKNMTTGEGGMVTTDRVDVAERLRHLRSHGMTTLSWDRHRGHGFSYDVVELGYNYRTTEIASAMGGVQLAKLPENNRKREALSNLYRQRLGALSGLHVPFSSPRGTSCHHLFPVLLRRAEMRGPLMTMLREGGIQTSIHYPPAHLFKYHRERLGTREGMLPRTEDVASRLITLPLYPSMRQEDLEHVVVCLTSALETIPSSMRE